MNPSSEDIKDMLIADSSLDLVFGESLFIGRVPATQNYCVTIFDTPGFPPQLTMNKDEIYDYPAIQIRIKSLDYKAGLENANNIKVSLHGRAHETWNGTFYSVIYCSGDPAFLSWDENNRATFIINFNLQRR